MKMFKPTYYDLRAGDLGWILANPIRWQNAAYQIWKKRLDYIDELSLNTWRDGAEGYRLNRIWEELYERCAAIKYPDMVNGVAWTEEADRECLKNMARGSFYLYKGGVKVTGYFNTSDPLYVGHPDVSF